MRSVLVGVILAMWSGCSDGNKSSGGGDLALRDLLTNADQLTTADLNGSGDLAQSTDRIAALQALTQSCTAASTAKYSTDDGSPATVDICKLVGAFFWKSDMDVDCDGQSTTQCNLGTDPDYQDQTSFTQSDDTTPLDAAALPYVVVPLPSARFNYMTSNIKPGALVAVLYNGKLSYGVFGDEGPSNIIGEASYAMAKSLGIDADPSTGGIDSGVTFIVFTGNGAVVSPIENHAAAITLGDSLTQTLIQNN